MLLLHCQLYVRNTTAVEANQEIAIIACEILKDCFLLLLYLKDCCCCTKRTAVIDGVIPTDCFPALNKRTDAFAGAVPRGLMLYQGDCSCCWTCSKGCDVASGATQRTVNGF
jgi:hypothetical protein